MTSNPILKTNLGKDLLFLARKGDLLVSSEQRNEAWAFFLLNNITQHSGIDDRTYLALNLPGEFFSKESNLKKIVKPHIEITKIMGKVDTGTLVSLFANCGNTLLSKSWVLDEVKAVRKEIGESHLGEGDKLLTLISERRKNILSLYNESSKLIEDNYPLLRNYLYEDRVQSSKNLLADFTTNELVKIIPAAPALSLNISFSTTLLNKQNENAVLNIGVWVVSYTFNNEKYSYPVLSPRLTENSLFRDETYKIENESSIALLVRTLLLSRIVKILGLRTTVIVKKDFVKSQSYHLRTLPYLGNQKKPTPSDNAVVNFINNNETASSAWLDIEEFIEGKFALAVSFEEFEKIFNLAKVEVSRLGALESHWKETLLPILWSSEGIARLTYVKGN